MTEIKTIDDLIDRIIYLDKMGYIDPLKQPAAAYDAFALALDAAKELRENMRKSTSRAEKDRSFLIRLSLPQWSEAEKIANRNIHYQDSTTQEYIDKEIAKLVLKIRKHLEENP